MKVLRAFFFLTGAFALLCDDWEKDRVTNWGIEGRVEANEGVVIRLRGAEKERRLAIGVTTAVVVHLPKLWDERRRFGVAKAEGD